MRHLRPAARAALLQLQFALRRMSRLPWLGFQVRFRSRQGDRRLVAPSFRRWTRARFGFRLSEANARYRRRSPRLRSLQTLRKTLPARAKPDPLRLSALSEPLRRQWPKWQRVIGNLPGQGEEDRSRIAIPGPFRFSRKQ